MSQESCYVRAVQSGLSKRGRAGEWAQPQRRGASRQRAALLVGLTLDPFALALSGASVARSAGDSISSIDVLSNRADLVSGGDVLVAVHLAAGAIRRPYASA